MPEDNTPPSKHSKTLEQKLNCGSGPFSALIQVEFLALKVLVKILGCKYITKAYSASGQYFSTHFWHSFEISSECLRRHWAEHIPRAHRS